MKEVITSCCDSVFRRKATNTMKTTINFSNPTNIVRMTLLEITSSNVQIGKDTSAEIMKEAMWSPIGVTVWPHVRKIIRESQFNRERDLKLLSYMLCRRYGNNSKRGRLTKENFKSLEEATCKMSWDINQEKTNLKRYKNGRTWDR